MNPELEALRAEAKNRANMDARFRARLTLAVRVEEELAGGRPASRWERHDRQERLAIVLHALDRDENYQRSIRYVGPPL